MVDLSTPLLLKTALMTIDVENPEEVRRLAHRIAADVGPDASAALREFLANVREHCPCKSVDIVELPSVLIAYDHGGGFRDGRSRKPEGEGGYGLRIMSALGAEVRSWAEGTVFVMVHNPM